MIFARQIKFIDELESFIYDQLRRSIEQDGFFIVDSITQEQLFEKGQDGDGFKLAGYTRFTIRIKASKGQPFDRTTLKDTGDFYDSIRIDARANTFQISSSVPYDTKLVEQYGPNILKPSVETMSEFFRLYFVPNIKNQLDGQLTR